MKILHTSDWHFGIGFNGIDVTADQEFFIDRICDIIDGYGVDAVLIAGDIFDRSNAGAEAVVLYDKAVTRLVLEKKVKVFLVAGNHDGAARLASCRKLLAEGGLYIAGTPETGAEYVAFGNADIYLLPWLSTDRIKALYPDKAEEISSLEDAYRIVCNDMRSGFRADRRHILVSHAFIVDSEVSESDRAAQVGSAAAVSADVFDGFDYVALGHIHKPQNVTDTIRYSGTPMPYSFGKEETQEKSVTLIDTRDMTKTVVPLPLLHRRKTLTGTYDEIAHGDYPEEIRNAYLRIGITDVHAGSDTFAALREKFPNALEFSSKSYEDENGRVTMTAEQLEHIEDDPVELFRSFCIDTFGELPDEHRLSLFTAALEKSEKETEE